MTSASTLSAMASFARSSCFFDSSSALRARLRASSGRPARRCASARRLRRTERPRPIALIDTSLRIASSRRARPRKGARRGRTRTQGPTGDSHREHCRLGAGRLRARTRAGRCPGRPVRGSRPRVHHGPRSRCAGDSSARRSASPVRHARAPRRTVRDGRTGAPATRAATPRRNWAAHLGRAQDFARGARSPAPWAAKAWAVSRKIAVARLRSPTAKCACASRYFASI